MNERLDDLRLALLSKHPSGEGGIRSGERMRAASVSKIESLCLEMTRRIARGETPCIESVNFAEHEKDCSSGEGLRPKETSERGTRKITFNGRNRRSRFPAVVFLLSKIHKFLLSGNAETRRELYYGNMEVFTSQREVDDVVRDICCILNVPCWELGVKSRGKGLVAGPLIFKRNRHLTNCHKMGGVLIPEDIAQVELISTSVRWVLIIEKEAAFQNILGSGALSKFQECLFITGKGYPDVNTRLLVRRLWECFGIPILALVDADPYGIEIMCTYRFGSKNSCSFSDRLACPSVRWLGVHPSDIKKLAVNYAEMTEKDTQRASCLAKRPYVAENESIRNEVKILLEEKVKAEIEGLSGVSPRYMTDVYIPGKVECGECL